MTLLDDMLALLPDNTAGDIGADDLRTIVTDLYNQSVAVQAASQPLDSDLTAIAALTATTDSLIQAKGSAWTARTIAQLLVDLAAPGTTFQPLDSDLTTLASLTATTDSIIQSKGSAWSSRTLAQLMVDLAALGTTFQPLDADLTTIAGLTATTNNFIVGVSSAWASRTPTQVKTTLAIAESDVTNLVTDLAAKAPLASPTFTGTVTTAAITATGTVGVTGEITATKRISPGVFNLTDGATISVDASLGNTAVIVLTGNGHELSVPTNGSTHQRLLVIIGDGTGGFSMTLNAGIKDPNSYYTGVSTGAGKLSYLGLAYDGVQWNVLAFAKGYN